MTKNSKTEFGRHLRERRVEADISLRSAAKKIGVSAVYLGEVERGVRPPIKKKHWKRLLAAVPTLDRVTLERLAADARPIQLDLRGAAPKYQDLALSLARRLENHDLSDKDFEKLIAFLGDADD